VPLASWPPKPICKAMPSTFEFCLPSSGKAVPSGPDWLHEIKYDGFRVRLERNWVHYGGHKS
jgi:ATP-dependent DNA ligase